RAASAFARARRKCEVIVNFATMAALPLARDEAAAQNRRPNARPMRIGITSKLFLALLLTSVAIAIVVSVAAQIALKSGFRNYVDEREERRLSAVADG